MKKICIALLVLIHISFQSFGQNDTKPIGSYVILGDEPVVVCVKADFPVYSFVVGLPNYSADQCGDSVRNYLRHTYNRSLSEIRGGSNFTIYNLSATYTESDIESNIAVEMLTVSYTYDISFYFKDGRFKYDVVYSKYNVEVNMRNISTYDALKRVAEDDGKSIIKYYYSNVNW